MSPGSVQSNFQGSFRIVIPFWGCRVGMSLPIARCPRGWPTSSQAAMYALAASRRRA